LSFGRSYNRHVKTNAFMTALWRERATAILRTDSQARAAAAMEAAVKGGFKLIEFTLTVPGAIELISQFAGRDDLLVGAGTVLTLVQARAAARAGASFLVSPVVDEEIIQFACGEGIPSLPGAHTPSEMWRAHRAGAPLVKLFPSPAGGPVALRAILGPMPFLQIVPTHGVDEANVSAWLGAGAYAVGFVSSLFDPALMAADAMDRIEDRARRLLTAARTLQRPDLPPPVSPPAL
jgi:Entner-Doudoroff aldolase